MSIAARMIALMRQPLLVEYLIVAGGGGAGGALSIGPPFQQGGGGGAGGLLQGSGFRAVTGPVVVGAGGLDGPPDTVTFGQDGENSSYGGLVAIGGGGGAPAGSNGRPGGSGGGAGNSDTGPKLGGAGTPGQGHDGGPGSGTVFSSGAGGGAGSAATQPSGNAVPGAGVVSSINGTAIVYANGGPIGGTSTPSGAGSGAGVNGRAGVVVIAYQGGVRATGGIIDTTSRPGWTLHTFFTSGTFTVLG